MPTWKVSVVPIAANLCQFCCLKKGFGFGMTLQAPVFQFHFHLQSLVQEAEIGFHLVKAYSRVKFLAIDDDNAYAHCSLSTALPYGDTHGCAPGQHSSSWVSKVLFPTNDENEVWATAGEREKFIFFVCTKYIQFIAEDNAFSQPYGATTLHLKEGRHTWVSSYFFTSFTKGRRLEGNFWRWENLSRKKDARAVKVDNLE